MKKILKRVFIGLLCIIVASVAGVWVLLSSGGKDIEDRIVTDAAGSTYRVHVEKDTTYAIVTDSDGKIWGADFDGDTVGSTRVPLDGEYSLDDIPTQFTGEHVDQTANINDYMGEVNNTTANNAVPEETTAAPEDQLQVYRIQKYQDIIAGGTYMMNITMTTDGVQDPPVTMAVKNGNLYVAMEMDGMSMRMIYMAQNDTMYMLIDMLKKYCEIPKDMIGEDMDVSAITSDFEIKGLGEVTASETEINGNKLICESYTDDEGALVSYYFDQNDMLVRRDYLYPNGKSDSTYFSQITTDVDDSYFRIPDKYSYLNISWLLEMGT